MGWIAVQRAPACAWRPVAPEAIAARASLQSAEPRAEVGANITREENHMRLSDTHANRYGRSPRRAGGGAPQKSIVAGPPCGTVNRVSAAPPRTARRIDLDALDEAAWATRIRAALADYPRTAKELGRLQGARCYPAYYRALKHLETEGAIVGLPPGPRQSKWHYHLREAV